jgi:hypothetical protein
MEPKFDILDAIARSPALRARGTLKAWMAENLEALSKRLKMQQPDWGALAEIFVSAGLSDSRGKPPSAEVTRKTWYRVKREKTAPHRATKTPNADLNPSLPSSPVISPPPPEDEDDFQFRPVQRPTR